jgi:dTDP-4-dehydrorhamnose reductase
MNILILGAYGLLGEGLSRYLEDLGHTVLKQGRRESADVRFDPVQKNSLFSSLDTIKPDAVVNLAALTNVDQCEGDVQLAYHANTKIVENLAGYINTHGSGITLIQISTDQLYDGAGPHNEEAVNPCNVYALTKYMADLEAERCGGVVFRTNFFGKSGAGNRISFSDWVVNSLKAGKEITIFEDVWFNALHLVTLCRFIGEAVKKPKPGIFNVGSENGMTKAQFALQLAGELGFDNGLMTVGKSTDLNLKARRPLDMRMDLSKFRETYGVKIPAMAEEVSRAAAEYIADSRK